MSEKYYVDIYSDEMIVISETVAFSRLWRQYFIVYVSFPVMRSDWLQCAEKRSGGMHNH